ncbi:MAG: hypothetical protein N2515_05170, partial [Deltaproteobacteria bacterium]|nr:hypothetical protein [Deltaproteobacteria bacterium]
CIRDRPKDPPGLCTVSRFRTASVDPVPLINEMAQALLRSGFDVGQWRWEQFGVSLNCQKRGYFLVRMECFDEWILTVTDLDEDKTSPDGSSTEEQEDLRSVLWCLHETLAKHHGIRKLRWIPRHQKHCFFRKESPTPFF